MKTILYVDDNEEMIELVGLVLSKSGYELHSLTDSEATLNYCLENTPDLVLMDLNMPGMNGFETTRLLRQQGFTNPIVVFTSSESDRDKEKAFSAGCDDYVVKDMEMKGLEHVMDTFLMKAGNM